MPEKQTMAFLKTHTISELDELHEVVISSDLEHTQFTPGSFHAKTTRINLGASILDSGEYDRGINAQGSIARAGPTFLVALHREASSNGLLINNNQFVAFGHDSAVDAYGDIGVKWATLTIQKEEWFRVSKDLAYWVKNLDQPRIMSVQPSSQTMAEFLDIFH